MSDKLLVALIGALAGSVSGAISSVVAPWAKWGIEKRRKRIERRTELVRHWERILSADDFSRKHILNDHTYGILRAMLSENVLKVIERPGTHIHMYASGWPGQDRDRVLLQEEIARIQKEWRLV